MCVLSSVETKGPQSTAPLLLAIPRKALLSTANITSMLLRFLLHPHRYVHTYAWSTDICIHTYYDSYMNKDIGIHGEIAIMLPANPSIFIMLPTRTSSHRAKWCYRQRPKTIIIDRAPLTRIWTIGSRRKVIPPRWTRSQNRSRSTPMPTHPRV